jgi:hypothetical protein
MALKRIVLPRQAPVLALAAPARADAAGKRVTTTVAARPPRQRFAHGTIVEVRRRLARAPLSGRWMVIFVRATVFDSAVSGADDDCYIVRYPACSGTAPSGRMACVPAADVREARRASR